MTAGVLGRRPRLWHEWRAVGAEHTMALPRSRGGRDPPLHQRLVEVVDQIIRVFETDGEPQQAFG